MHFTAVYHAPDIRIDLDISLVNPDTYQIGKRLKENQYWKHLP